MNIRSAELLQNSQENLANNLLRARELRQAGEIEAQRNAIEQSFRNAMMQHYAGIEQKQAEAAALQEKRLGVAESANQNNFQRQLQQSAIAQKQDMLKTIMQLNATGQLNADGIKSVNQWLSTDPDMSKAGIQLATPPNPSRDPQHRDSALTQGMNMLESLRAQAAAATDPQEKAQYSQYADDLEAAITHGRPGETDVTTDAKGNPLRMTTKTFGTPGAATAGADSSVDGADTPAMPVSVPDTRGLWDRLTGAPVPVPAGLASPGDVTLTPQDLTPMRRYPTPPASHVAYLQANQTPKVMADFDELYGPGASQMALRPIAGGGGFPISVPASSPPAVAAQ